MDTPKPAADRVRHILQAMERSIDSARRQRLHTNGVPSTPVIPATAPVNQTIFPRAANPVVQQDPSGVNGAAPRLKARPKRTDGFPSPFDQPVYRSKTA